MSTRIEDSKFPAEPTPNRNEEAPSLPDIRNEPKREDKVPLFLLPPREPGDQQAERSYTTATAEGTQTEFFTLRTIPVILKKWES